MKSLIRFLLRALPRPLLIRLSYPFRSLIRPFLSGNRVSCPVCSRSFSRMLPYGVVPRPNVLCPSCLSLERHRLIWLYLIRVPGILTFPVKLLHVAPEQCFHGRFRKMGHIDYVTADLESPLAEYHFDLHSIPFDSDTFDLVLCNHVLEHVEDDRRVMGEILRVLSPGGLAILQVPQDPGLEVTYEDPGITDPREREKHFGQKDHLRLYGKDYPVRLREAGFNVVEWPVADHFQPDEIERFRLAPGETLYLAFKSQ
ncbi:MAG: methyltransferase domain-containing protein [Bacteroidales bacterium]